METAVTLPGATEGAGEKYHIINLSHYYILSIRKQAKIQHSSVPLLLPEKTIMTMAFPNFTSTT